MSTEKKPSKRKDRQKEVRQQAATEWIRTNYLDGGRLRLDSVRQQIQIQDPLKAGELARLVSLPAEEIGAYGSNCRLKNSWYVSMGQIAG